MAATKTPFRFQKDIARDFNITKHLVSTLVCESVQSPDKLRAKRRKDGLRLLKKDAISETTSAIMETGQPIVSVSQIQQAVKELTSYDLDKVFVRKFLRQ